MDFYLVVRLVSGEGYVVQATKETLVQAKKDIIAHDGTWELFYIEAESNDDAIARLIRMRNGDTSIQRYVPPTDVIWDIVPPFISMNSVGA